MDYALIGTGHMATFLVERLLAAGHRCTAVWGRNEAKARQFADRLQTSVAPSAQQCGSSAPVCLLAVGDAGIAPMAQSLRLPAQAVIHFAGSVSIDILAPVSPHHGVLWPVYSILSHDLPTHRNIPAGWEASGRQAAGAIAQIAASFTDQAFEANGDQRHWMHLCAVLGNNFINHLLAISQRLCSSHGLSFDQLRPLLEQTFGRALSGNPVALQSGPARRGDAPTLQRHHGMLASEPHWQQVYDALSASIENMYRPIGPDKATKD
jgi:predicted short-subunit dehydrogenase-like oxidoreductase (DUF2520 family)